MHISKLTIVSIILLISESSLALEYNRQNHRTNTDFLLHEGGLINNQNGPKKENISPTFNNQNDYSAQFPPLKSPTTSQTQNVASHSGSQHNPQASGGKRDYVAPQLPTPKPVQQNNQHTTGHMGNMAASQFPALKPTQQNNNPSPGNKRDYVAPQFPTLKPVQQNNQHTPGNMGNMAASQFPALKPAQQNSNPSPGNNRRDYVAPQYPTPKPQNTQGSTSKVKDLINFYDGKNKDQMPTNGRPSYSTTLQGNKNGPSSTTKFSQPPQPTSSPQATKPMSFSSIAAGGSKPANQVTTPKPSTNPPARPSSPVLPSSIVNNQGNANGNRASDAELQTLSEELLRKDTNNPTRYITINYQEKTTSQSKDDKAPQPLVTVSPEVWNIPTIQKFLPLLDNYERDTLVNEYVTPQERTEENTFMDEIMATQVMRHLMTFLKNKGYVTPDPKQQRDFVKQLWFNLYSRGKGKISSSGFEHVFVSELKNGAVSGLHNWIYFAKEEAANRINYLGYLKYVELNDKGAVMKIHFNQQGVDKPVNSMFIGTSPELEMALYTLCFVTRADNECKLKLGSKDVEIITHTFRYRSKNYIGSAYAAI